MEYTKPMEDVINAKNQALAQIGSAKTEQELTEIKIYATLVTVP